jgi:phosphoribosylformylglycinamidine synthase
VDVMLKPEIHDPQGEAVLAAAHRLGFGQVGAVRQGKRFEIEIETDGAADAGLADAGLADERVLAAVTEIAAELLANPVIEEFTVRSAG